MRVKKPEIFLLTAALLVPLNATGAAAPVQGEAGREVAFLFDNLWWLLFMAGFAGLVAGGFKKRIDPHIDGDRVLRHDSAAKLSHWTHAVGCTLLLATGAALGFFFFPRLLPGVEGAALLMDIHFIGALLFIFGGFYWLANTIISPWRFTEHMPDSGSLMEGIIHYAHIFGLTGKKVRPAKYDGSERLAFVPIVLFAALLIITGFIKLSARFMAVPTGLLSTMTWLHDASALVMLVLFFFHVLLAAVVPWSWPLLKSMFTGYVSLDFARDHHPVWYEELSGTTEKEKS